MEPMTMMALGGLAGGLLGGMGGSKQAGTTTTINDIPAWLKPYVTGMLGQAQPMFNQQAGQGQSPVVGASQDEMMKTIQGQYLDPRSNPFLQETFQQGANEIRGAMSPSFGHMQAFGGNSGANQALGRSLGNFATNLYGNNYNQERNRQFGATAAGPDFATSGTGSAFAPFNQYSNLLKGWGSQQTQPYFNNPTGGVLGGALTGASMGRMFGGGGAGGGAPFGMGTGMTPGMNLGGWL
jgi:hypothetical protein